MQQPPPHPKMDSSSGLTSISPAPEAMLNPTLAVELTGEAVLNSPIRLFTPVSSLQTTDSPEILLNTLTSLDEENSSSQLTSTRLIKSDSLVPQGFWGELNGRELPSEVVLHIFSHFNLWQLLALRRVSKVWKHFAEDWQLWLAILQKHFSWFMRGHFWRFFLVYPLENILVNYLDRVFELDHRRNLSFKEFIEVTKIPFISGRFYGVEHDENLLRDFFVMSSLQNYAHSNTIKQNYSAAVSEHDLVAQGLFAKHLAEKLAPYRNNLINSHFYKALPNNLYFPFALLILSSRLLDEVFAIILIHDYILKVYYALPVWENETNNQRMIRAKPDILSILLNNKFTRMLSGEGLLVIDASVFYLIQFLIEEWMALKPVSIGETEQAQLNRIRMEKIDELFGRLSRTAWLSYVKCGYAQSKIFLEGLRGEQPTLLARVDSAILLEVARWLAKKDGRDIFPILVCPPLLNKLDDDSLLAIADLIGFIYIPMLFEPGSGFPERLRHSTSPDPNVVPPFVRLISFPQFKEINQIDYTKYILCIRDYLAVLKDDQIVKAILRSNGIFRYVIQNNIFQERLTSSVILKLSSAHFEFFDIFLKHEDLLAKKLTPEAALELAAQETLLPRVLKLYNLYKEKWSHKQLYWLYVKLDAHNAAFRGLTQVAQSFKQELGKLITEKEAQGIKAAQQCRERERRNAEHSSSALAKRQNYYPSSPPAKSLIEDPSEKSSSWLILLLIVGGALGLILTGISILAWIHVPLAISLMMFMLEGTSISLSSAINLCLGIGLGLIGASTAGAIFTYYAKECLFLFYSLKNTASNICYQIKQFFSPFPKQDPLHQVKDTSSLITVDNQKVINESGSWECFTSHIHSLSSYLLGRNSSASSRSKSGPSITSPSEIKRPSVNNS